YFSSGRPDSVTFTVNFTLDNGNPLNVPALGGSSKTVTLAAGGTAILEAPNVGDLQQGYVSLQLPPGVTGDGVFRQSVAGQQDQEAVVPLSFGLTGGQNMIYDDTNFIMAVAIVNYSSVVNTVTITATDLNGNQIGTASSVVLQPFGKTESVLHNLPGL